MRKSVDNKNRELAYMGMSSLMLVGLLFLAGCGSPSGPPGARPGMGPPGAPVGGGSPAASANGGAPSQKSVADAVAKSSDMLAQNNQDSKLPGMAPGQIPGAPVKSDGSNDSSADAEGVNPMAPTAKVEQAGNLVSLASDIIFLKGNPFLDRLPKPIVEAMTASSPTDPGKAEAPPDPFANVSLLGIAYHAKSPMAIVSVSGGETQTQMVRTGDVLMMDGGQIKVLSISQDSVIFQKLGTGGEKRTMSLPSLIGYTSSGASARTADSSGGGGTIAKASAPRADQPVTPDLGAIMSGLSGKAPAGGMNGGMDNLSNLKKLGRGSAGGDMKAPGMSLQEH